MIVKTWEDIQKPLTPAQKKMLEELKNRPINYEDIPPLTEEQLSRARRVTPEEFLARHGIIKQ